MSSSVLRGALSSADQTQLEAVLEGSGSLSGTLTEQRFLIGDLTTGIALAAVLSASGAIVADFTSADPRASLSASGTIAAALTTSIRMAAELRGVGTLHALLSHTPSGGFDTVGRPGDIWRATPAPSRNGATPRPSRNGSAPRMVIP